MIILPWTPKGHVTRGNLHEAILQLATQQTLRCKLQEKNSRVTPYFATAIVALRVARKVERPSTFRDVARQVANVWHPLCNLKGFLFVIVASRVVRKVASCNMALKYVWNVQCALTNHRRDPYVTETIDNEWFPIFHGTNYFCFVLTLICM